MDDVTAPDMDLAPPHASPLPEGVAPTPEAVNLAAVLVTEPDASWLKKQADIAHRQWKADDESRQGMLRTWARIVKLVLAQNDTMSGPAEGGQKPCLPILVKILLRIWARVTAMVIENDPIVVPTTPSADDRAERLSAHLDWQRRCKNPDWAPGMSASVMEWGIACAFRRVGWDIIRNRWHVDPLSMFDVVIPYHQTMLSPNLSDVPHYTVQRRRSRHELEQLEDLGWYTNVKKLFEPEEDEEEPERDGPYASTINDTTTSATSTNPIADVVDRAQGVDRPKTGDDDTDGVYLILERYYWTRLPGQSRMSPVILSFEASTKTVLRLSLREEEDPLDRKRFDLELQANQMRFQNEMAQFQASFAPSPFGTQEPGALPGAPPGAPPIPPPQIDQGGAPPPSAPPVLQQPRPVRTRVIDEIIYYPFFPNPEGAYSFGVGMIALGANEIANTIAGEDLLARRLSNMKGGFIAGDLLGMDVGDIKLEMGKFKRLKNASSDQIKAGIIPMDFGPPQGNLMEPINMLGSGAEEALSSPALMSGEPGPSHETASGVRSRLSAALSALSTACQQFLLSLAYEYKVIARLNYLYLDDVEFFAVTKSDPSGLAQPTLMHVAREEYAEDFDITFSADAKLATEPEMAENAINAYQMILNDPMLTQNMQLRMASSKLALKALRMKKLADMLPDQVPPGMMPPMPPPGPGGPGGPPQKENPNAPGPNMAGPQPDGNRGLAGGLDNPLLPPPPDAGLPTSLPLPR